MTKINIRLSDALHMQLAVLAEQEGMSISRLINSAVTEKMSTLISTEYLERRAGRGSRKKLDRFLRNSIQPANS